LDLIIFTEKKFFKRVDEKQQTWESLGVLPE
jgi:hypothetical protein